LLFLVPGMNETLAHSTARPILRCAAAGAERRREPGAEIGLLVMIEEAFLHCAKALVRSPVGCGRHIDRRVFPTLCRMLLDHVKDSREEKRMAQCCDCGSN